MVDVDVSVAAYGCDELAEMTDEDRAYLDKNKIDTDKAHKRVLNAIYNVPNGFVEINRELKQSVEDLVDQSSFEQGYLCEKYFKEGIKIGINVVTNGASEYIEDGEM